MKQFFHVMRFEYLNYAKNKVFLGLTAVLVIGIAVLLFFPRISQAIGPGEGDASVEEGPKTVVALVDQTGADPQSTLSFLSAGMQDYQIQLAQGEEAELKQALEDGVYQGVILLQNPLSYQYWVKDAKLYDSTTNLLDALLLQKYQADAMEQAGLSAGEAQEILTTQVQGEVVQTGKNQMQSFFYTYILMFMLYFAIILYGQFVATGVAEEKSSRAMELLITSAKPKNLMFGKIIGIGAAGMTQMAVILLAGFGCYNLNRQYWGDNPIIASIFGMPLSILLYTVLFFVLGFFLYAFLFGALGSLASRSEDVSALIMPVIILFIIAFFVVMFSMGSGNVDSPLMVACSYIPFTSPMAMFTRIAMGSVAAWEIILSVLILLVSTVVVGWISAAIYRVGVLLYGKPPKLTEVFRMVKRAR